MLGEYSLEGLLGRQRKVRPPLSLTVWQEFVKWAHFIFESERHIAFGKLGNYGYKIEEKSGRKIPFLFISETFLKAHTLTARYPSFVLKPPVKISPPAILKHLPDSVTEEDVKTVVGVVCESIEELLSGPQVELRIDLEVMGQIAKSKNQVWFEYVLPPAPSLKEKLKQTSLRFRIDQEDKKQNLSKLALLTNSANEGLPKIDRQRPTSRKLLDRSSSKKDKMPQIEQRPSSKEKPARELRKGNSLTKLAKVDLEEGRDTLRDFGRTTRINSFARTDKEGSEAIGWEMMGAGADPLKKNQDFARLTGNLKTLMETKFQFPQESISRHLPVIDVFARTLACPVATQRQNPLVAARVGSNLSSGAQKLYILPQGITYVRSNQTTLDKRKQRAPVEIISSQLEYRLRMQAKRTPRQEQLLTIKEQDYHRYQKLFVMIDEKNVYELTQAQLGFVFGLIDSKYGQQDGQTPYKFRAIIMQNIEEVKQSHIRAGQKAIIDYVLLDPTERQRLNVHYRYKAPIFYGEQTFHPRKHDPQSLFLTCRPKIEERLLKNTSNTLKIQSLWFDQYQQRSLIVLPSALDNYLSIEQFFDHNRTTIRKFKENIINEWIPLLTNIYKHQITELNRHQVKSNLFFDSTATQLHVLARGVVERELSKYVDFMQKFEKAELNPPDTVVFLERTRNRYEECFLSVRLSHRRDEIYFMDNLDEIQLKLTEIVDLLIQTTIELPRPQNLITSTKKLYQLSIPAEGDKAYQSAKATVRRIARINIDNTKKCIQIYSKYAFLLTEMRSVEQWVFTGDHDRRQYSLTLSKYRELYDEVQIEVPSFIRINMIYVDSSELKRYLLNSIDQILRRLERAVYDLVAKRNEEIHDELSKMVSVATSAAPTCERLVEIEAAVDNYRRTDIRRLQEKQNDVTKWVSITLYNTLYPVSEDDLAAIHDTAIFLRQIHAKLDIADTKIYESRRRLEIQAKDDGHNFHARLVQLGKEIETLKEFGSVILKDSALQLLLNCRQKINQLKMQLKDLNKRQSLLAIDETDGQKLSEWDRSLKPFEELWTLVKDYTVYSNSWTRQSIFKQDADFITSQTKTMFKNINVLGNNPFIRKLAPLTVKIAEDLADDIRNFQKYIPVIAVFSNPGLKPRHFAAISKTIHYEGDTLSPQTNLFLNKVVGLGAAEHIEQLQVISQTASKEYAIETTLQKIAKEWETARFQMKRYKDSFVNILTGSSIEQIQALVDDHSLKVLTMKGSAYARTFTNQIQDLEDWLSYTNEMLDYAIKVQGVWMYLEPVMTSPDILKHLSVEGSKFRVVDETWRDVTGTFTKIGLVKDIAKDKRIVPSLKQCHANLQIVQKGLNSYLQSKRLSFPRFFFLSNEQLLQILSETKDPTRVQPHLKKCFEGISRLQFQDGKLIQGMFSAEDEYVSFTSKINTVLARGNVDEWLIDVESKMRLSVRRQIKDSYEDYTMHPRPECLLKRCAMAVLAVQMGRWTSLVESSIRESSLDEGVVSNQGQLREIVELIKSSGLKPINIMTLQSLIVLSVHNLDVIRQLAAHNVTSIADFAWESQLRYFYPYDSETKDKVTEVRILNAICPFNHQYLGNTSRLVITPLTDRCYRTLCSAIFLNYGGAPEGPAGTGKTETVKDLAKALACQCVVFNCSDGLDYKAMGKFFKGLAASGAWSCFDEFNRINLQVLSVVAQQILCIQAAKAKGKPNLFFEDVELPLLPTANVFITMNPGYAGRSQLPDNLKALFRAVAMMIPDYAMIAEISLYSYGFEQARALARKIVTTYKLCSEQLSSQEHYDYGMRAVKSVLVAAGNLKRKNPTLEESSLILKAINDVNVAKFLAFDIPLFAGITSDLFPDISPPPIDYAFLVAEIKAEYEKLGLTLNQYMLQKIIQIYDMLLVRHGLMVVGQPFAGKTTALNILAHALGHCADNMNEQSVEVCRINPKAITQKQLYGYFDEVSHEWFDGVLAVKFRNFATAETSIRKWLVLDGPVDAVWIENMNTVLDDNKKLCLNSGQIIAMSRSMSLIFEPMDLLAASPATVSRCGMIYLEPASLGHRVLIDAWLVKNKWMSDDLTKILAEYLSLLDDIYAVVRNLKTVCFVSVFGLTDVFLQMLTTQLIKIKKFIDNNPEDWATYQEKYRTSLMAGVFVWAVVWSFGVAVDSASRKQFDTGLKKVLAGDITSGKKKKNVSFPEKLTFFDYLFRIGSEKLNYQWMRWVDLIHDSHPANTKVHEVIVKTADIVRYTHLLELALAQAVPLLLCGPTGTGKTTLVKDYYALSANQKQIGFLEVVFSSRTTCSQALEQIQGKLDKRGSRHILGPKLTPQLMVFVDDLSMPVKEQYGAQPPIELLRQLVDQGGFYDLREKEKSFKQTVDLLFVYGMAAVNNDITPRFLRHSRLVSVTNFDEDTLTRIFGTLLTLSFQGHPQQKQMSTLLKYCIELYNDCLKKLLPTPAKSHYLFNLRDLWKFVVGICRADRNKLHSENIGRLWAHEAKRVFLDRLLPSEKQMVGDMIASMGKRWGKNVDDVYFSDILSGHERSYEEIADLEKVGLAVSTALSNYNLVSDKPMDLVLFDYALKHVLIILRVIKQPRTSALLVGLGGSGRKSFAQLASFVADYSPVSLQIGKNYGYAQFRQDLRGIFREIGVKNKCLSFVFSDAHIKQQQFLEDINNILNLGTVPNLFPPDQRIDICEAVRKDAAEQIGGELTPDRLFAFFIGRIKEQLKLIVCFSPIGQAFRQRLRLFPSLVNCTTIDWFEEWPREGLLSVARRFLQRTELRYRQAYIQMVQFVHSSCKGWSQVLKEQLGRHFYVTPTSYIEFISSFRQLLADKRRKNKELIFKYDNGYSKIVSTEDSVERMQRTLTEMKPQLKKAAEETAYKMEMVAIQKEEADVIMSQISGEERIVLEAVNEANAIKQDCEKELAIALPKLKAAENALLVLDKNSLTELRAMANPPIAVKLTLQGLCLLVDPAPKEKTKNEKTLKMETDWWAASVRNLGNPKLLSDLINFNKQGLTEGVVTALGKFLLDPANRDILSVQNVANSSLACECIIQWVNGIYNFYFVNKKVKPKKESLKTAEEKVKALNQKLEAKRQELDSANRKVNDLREELTAAQNNKQRLEKEYADCEISLQRAEVIIANLGGQKVRWLQLSQQYKAEAETLDIQVFVASAQISYLGPFTQSFRQRILEQWTNQLNKTALKVVPGTELSLAKVLGDPIRIRQWNLNGLPYDGFSVENGIILYNSKRWPLLIDPQGQCNRWLKKQEAHRKLKVLKVTEDNFLRNLQNCIQFGSPVLVQNLGSEISAGLTPVLLRQTYKKGATTYLKMGQNVLIYSHDFYLYMTTKLRNPHYLPEVCTQAVLINFMITQAGLTDQLLALLVSQERPDLESEKEKLVVESADNQRALQEIQDQILQLLSNSENILGDEKAINVLSAAKSKAGQIGEKQKLAQQTQALIDKARRQYLGMAGEGSLLFFAVSDLDSVDPMYQYSLTYFTDLFRFAIHNSERHNEVPARLASLRHYFRLSLFRNISRSLFQKDRLLFAALLVLRLQKPRADVLRYLLVSHGASKFSLEKPKDKWVSAELWAQACRLAEIAPFEELLSEFGGKEKKLLQEIVTQPHPFSKPLPTRYAHLPFLSKLLLYRCLRPQKMVQGFTRLVEEYLGSDFTRSLPFDLTTVYPDSTPYTPFLFILSPGADPFVAVSNFSRQRNAQLQSVSLGQGQGAVAERLIRVNMESGGWVVLQNCHLATSWMPTLEKIVEEMDGGEAGLHLNFRLWLTSYPSDVFPQSVLQRALKMTNQPAKGLKNNLMVSFLSDPVATEEFFQTCLHPAPFKKLLFGLCFFHALVQQRRKFGALGWNISYEFTESDLRISCRQLRIYLDGMQDELPLTALKYLIAECNYGGRVTDQNDRRLLLSLLDKFYDERAVSNPHFSYGDGDQYVLPNTLNSHQDYLNFIEGLPTFGSPELVGLHPNADITKDHAESNGLLQSLLGCGGESGTGASGGLSVEETVSAMVEQLLKADFPADFDEEASLKKYPLKYEESMNTVLNQELGRYNRLLKQIRGTCQQLLRAIKGELVMTAALEKMSKALFEGKVPELWLSRSYPSLKPLNSYITDLKKRCSFFRNWVQSGTPPTFWLSGFFFTQSFLTGVLQNYSRKHRIPVDELAFKFLFKTVEIAQTTGGANIYGLFIEGASWDSSRESLKEAEERELFAVCPPIYFKPERVSALGEGEYYETPLYKTQLRQGVLSTTGHSTNFVMMIRTPSRQQPSHWIRRGVAFLTQTA